MPKFKYIRWGNEGRSYSGLEFFYNETFEDYDPNMYNCKFTVIKNIEQYDEYLDYFNKLAKENRTEEETDDFELLDVLLNDWLDKNKKRPTYQDQIGPVISNCRMCDTEFEAFIVYETGEIFDHYCNECKEILMRNDR